jgi:hypothetical protein
MNSRRSFKGRANALYVVPDGLVNTNRIRINTLALAAALPTMHAFREYVESAGLMSYGPNIPDGFRHRDRGCTRGVNAPSREKHLLFPALSKPTLLISRFPRARAD